MAEEQNAEKTFGTEAVPPSAQRPAKVELDLDDAPFLEDDEPEKAPDSENSSAAEDKSAASVAPADAPRPSWKDRLRANRKKLLLAGISAVLLLVVWIVLNLFLFSAPSPPPAPEPEKVLAEPKPLPEAPVPLHTLQLESFWIEHKDTEGAIRFLTFTFSVPTENSTLFAEMNAKKLILRDALFYYLRNTPVKALTDEAKTRAFKNDILTVMNEHLATGKVSEILIQDYLIQ